MVVNGGATKRDRWGRWLLPLLITLFACEPVFAQESRDHEPGETVKGLKAWVTVRNDSIRGGDEVALELELRNVSEVAVFSLYRPVGLVIGTPGYVRVHLTRSDGTTVDIPQKTDEHEPPSERSFVRLQPGTSLKQRLKIPTIVNHTLHQAIDPGDYTLVLEVVFSDEGQQAGVQNAWAGTVFSNPVTLSVE